jgi:predicted component of type VI protein secretion system
MASLLIQTGRHSGKRLILPAAEVLVGRDADCKIRFSSTLISRKHCALRASGDSLWVRDLGSGNGTYVNDVLVDSPTLMEVGDTLRIGAMVFLLEAEGTESAANNEVTTPTAAQSAVSEPVASGPAPVMPPKPERVATPAPVTKAAKPAEKKPAKKSSGLSDAEIATWLSDPDVRAERDTAEITVVKSQPVKSQPVNLQKPPREETSSLSPGLGGVVPVAPSENTTVPLSDAAKSSASMQHPNPYVRAAAEVIYVYWQRRLGNIP